MKAKFQALWARLSKLDQAHVTALATAGIAQVVAYVPAWAPEKQKLIATAGIVIGAAYLVAHVIAQVVGVARDLLAAHVKPAELAADARKLIDDQVARLNLDQLAHDAVGRLNLDQLAHDALSGTNVAELVKGEFRKLLGAVDADSAAGSNAAPAAEASGPIPDPIQAATPQSAPSAVLATQPEQN